MTRDPTATGSRDSSATTELGERDENQGRTLSVWDAAVELGRLRAIPLPPRASEEATRV